MRLAILILSAVAVFSQEDKLQVVGSVFWGSTAPTAEHLSIDVDSRYKDNVLLIRKGRDPIAFCNIRMGRCWDVKWSWEREQVRLGVTSSFPAIKRTYRVYDSTTHDGAKLVYERVGGDGPTVPYPLPLKPGAGQAGAAWGSTKVTACCGGGQTSKVIREKW